MNCTVFLRSSTLLVLITLIFTGQTFAQSQIVFSKPIKSGAYIENVWPTSDGGYIAGGIYQWFDTTINAINYDHYILKTDSLGDMLWEKIYDFTTNDGWCISGSIIRELSDGGFAYISTVNCAQNPPQDLSKYKLLRLDSFGDTLWTNTYERTLRSMGQWVEPTADGGFIMTGYAAKIATSADVYLVKTDSLGVQKWNKEYELYGEEQATCIRQTIDGGYIVAGGSSHGNLFPRAHTWLLKLDSIGDTLWTKVFPWGMWNINAFVEVTPDNGYIVSVRDSNTLQVAFKTDSVGNLEWTQNFGDGYGCIAQTIDSGFAVFGNTYFTKTDSNGNVIFTKTTNFNPLFWRATTDNGFITTTGNYLIKTDCQGNYTFWDTVSCYPYATIDTTNDTTITPNGVIDIQQASNVVIYPNPSEGIFTVSGTGIRQIELFDLTGKFIFKKEESGPSITIDLSAYKKGLYFVKIVTNSETSIKKLVIE